MTGPHTLDDLLDPWPVARERGTELAGALRRVGVGRGDRVAWQLPNHLDAIALYRACWQIGAVAVPLHGRAGRREVADLVDALEPVVFLRSIDDVESLASAPSGVNVASTGAAPGRDGGVQPDDDAVVLFTAGSSGDPKGVRHTHRSLVYKAQLMVEVHGLSDDDVVLMPAPLAHISGLLNAVLVPAVAGMAVELMDRWSPAEALSVIESARVSFMVGPPTFFVDLMDDASFSSERVASLRLVSSGGAGVAPEFVDRATATLGALAKRSYGSTEAPTVATSLAGDDPLMARQHDGHAIGQAELRVVDGELQVRGPELFAGYLSPAQTALAMADGGWFRTGDLATISPTGWLTITGRLKDVVIRAGENISVGEVERVLEAHPAVALAAVVGVPDERLGEQVAAFVVVPEGTFDLGACRDWFAQRGVARFKTPERVIVVDSLPRLPSGKVDRAALRREI
jgi:acyl-CoA synthetase (AMP-forming)/AMP-acid ligase II